MNVLNSQQQRIVTMLKKYGDDDSNVSSKNGRTLEAIDEPVKYMNPRQFHTINIKQSIPKVSSSSDRRNDRISGMIPLRLETSLPVRKKSDYLHN
jgi:hypothetical protein